MSYIRLEHRVLNDLRVLDLTPAALTVHIYALDYSNEQGTDGAIPTKIAHRMMCQLDPADIVEAFKELVECGLWERTDDGYICPEFLAYGLAGAEQRATRAKWSEAKRRRTLHGVGNHALCLADQCPAKKAEVKNSTEGVESVPPQGWTTTPDHTRPDQTHKGSGSGTGAAAPTARSAGAPRGLGCVVRGAGESPWDFSLTVVSYDDEQPHSEFTLHPGPPEDSNEDVLALRRFRSIVEVARVNYMADFAALRERHKCSECRIEQTTDDEQPGLRIIVPTSILDSWLTKITRHVDSAIDLERYAS